MGRLGEYRVELPAPFVRQRIVWLPVVPHMGKQNDFRCSPLPADIIQLTGDIMILGKRIPSGREKNEEAIKLLEQLREKLYVDDISAARRAAFNLSWKQEDGLDILKEALFNDSPRTTKIAAVYGLRNMQGRMKKPALALLEQGLKSRKANIKNACSHALALMNQGPRGKSHSEKTQQKPVRFEIREIRGRRPSRGRVHHAREMHGQNHRSRR